MKIKKVYYVFNGRFPSEKAHALYVAKHCEAIHNLGFEVTVLAPNRFRKSKVGYPEFYNIKKSFKVFYLPTIDLYAFKLYRIAFLTNYLFFSIGVFVLFLFRSSKNSTIFCHESISSLVLSLSGKKVIYEMHDYPGKWRILYKLLFSIVFKIFTQNEWKKEMLVNEFEVVPEKIHVEPNAVDIGHFGTTISREEARVRLALPQDIFLILYTGHLFDWKGADVLAKAAGGLDATSRVVFVGGSEEDVAKFKESYGAVKNIQVEGYKKHQEIPLWQRAADCLVLPNTAKIDISKYYTSPMKLFEYMASCRPIIASDLPSIRAVASDKEITFVEPDDPWALVLAINTLKQNYDLYLEKTLAAKKLANLHTWEKRAERISNLSLR